MHVKVKSVRYIKDYILDIEFENGEKGTADFSGFVDRGGVFDRFRDQKYFAQAAIDPEWGVIAWPGDVDIAPETVYRLVTGKSSDEALEKMHGKAV